MINIQIKAAGIELTDAIRDYVEKRLSDVEKYNKKAMQDPMCHVEVGKDTEHHQKGEIFKASVNYTCGESKYFVVSVENDLYAAIDDMRDQLVRKMTDDKTKKETLWRRGARSVKKMFKGISKRNPHTSKY